MDPFTMALIGGGLGALTNKKKPLQGALMGAGMGYGGGLLTGGAAGAGGLLGNPMTAASYGTGLGSQQTAMLAAQEAGMGSMPISGSLMGNATSMMDTLKPFGQAANAAQGVLAQFPEEQAPPPPQLVQQNGGGILAQLANQPVPQSQMEVERAQRRMQRRGLV